MTFSPRCELLVWHAQTDEKKILKRLSNKRISSKYKEYARRLVTSGENVGHTSLKFYLPKTEEFTPEFIKKISDAGMTCTETLSYEPIRNKQGVVTGRKEVPIYEVYFTWWPVTKTFKSAQEKNRTLQDDIEGEAHDSTKGSRRISSEKLRKDKMNIDNALKCFDFFEKDPEAIRKVPIKQIQKSIEALLANECLHHYININFYDLGKISKEIDCLVEKKGELSWNECFKEKKILKILSKLDVLKTQIEGYQTYAIDLIKSIEKTESNMAEMKRQLNLLIKIQNELKMNKLNPEMGTHLSPEIQKYLNNELKSLEIDIQNEEDRSQNIDKEIYKLEIKLSALNPEYILAKYNTKIKELTEQREEFIAKADLLAIDVPFKKKRHDTLIEKTNTPNKEKLQQEKDQLYAKADKLSQEIIALKNRKESVLQDYSGQNPSYQIEIPLQSSENKRKGLNVMAMLEKALSLHQEKKYCLTGLNCSSSCRKLLEAGLSDNNLASSLCVMPFIDTPESVKQFGFYVTEYFKKNAYTSHYGTIEYYNDLIQNNLESISENNPLKSLIEEISTLISAVNELKNEGKLSNKAATKLTRDLYDLSINPSGKISSFITDYKKEPKAKGIINNIISFISCPFNKGDKGKLKNNSGLLESIEGLINTLLEKEKKSKSEEFSQKIDLSGNEFLPKTPFLSKQERVETSQNKCIDKFVEYKEKRKAMRTLNQEQLDPITPRKK